jgi:hypothetical protein
MAFTMPIFMKLTITYTSLDISCSQFYLKSDEKCRRFVRRVLYALEYIMASS